MGTQDINQKSGPTTTDESGPPATNTVPFLQAPSSRGSLAPSSHDSSSGTAGQQSDGSSKSPAAGQTAGTRRPGSSDPARQGSLEEGLAQLAQRDWQLNLDALEVRVAQNPSVLLLKRPQISAKVPKSGSRWSVSPPGILTPETYPWILAIPQRNEDAVMLRELRLTSLNMWDVMQPCVMHAGGDG